MTDNTPLGTFEEQVMLAVLRTGGIAPHHHELTRLCAAMMGRRCGAGIRVPRVRGGAPRGGQRRRAHRVARADDRTPANECLQQTGASRIRFLPGGPPRAARASERAGGLAPAAEASVMRPRAPAPRRSLDAL